MAVKIPTNEIHFTEHEKGLFIGNDVRLDVYEPTKLCSNFFILSEEDWLKGAIPDFAFG
jgi:hypothetical protein